MTKIFKGKKYLFEHVIKYDLDINPPFSAANMEPIILQKQVEGINSPTAPPVVSGMVSTVLAEDEHILIFS